MRERVTPARSTRSRQGSCCCSPAGPRSSRRSSSVSTSAISPTSTCVRRTSTGDPEGEIVETLEPPDEEELERRLAALRGVIELPIPAASAVKIGGERAYALARRGVEVEMPFRRSTVYSLDVVAYAGDSATLDMRVSSGTYVRAIAHALGGHCSTLRRTAVGPFHVADAVTPSAFAPGDLLSEEAVLALVAGYRTTMEVSP